MIKHDFLKIWEYLQIGEVLKLKNLNAKCLIGNALFLTPCIGTENRFFNIMSGLRVRTKIV